MRGSAATPATEERFLKNGIRVVSVYFPGSTNVSIFTYTPMGLASDGPNQSQWAHLVEHLVIRSTVPEDQLSAANAETLPDHMRLDAYGDTSNWKESLSHARRWLEGVPFTEQNLQAEKPKVKAECDYTVRNFATHKFAMAAWAQAFRHGALSAALKGDVNRASLAEIQSYRDSHLAVLSNTFVCVAGGVTPGEALAEASRQLGSLQSKASPVSPVKLHPGTHALTWDLNARHLVLSWPIPTADDPAFAALLATSQRLMMQFSSDLRLPKLTGMTFAGTDLRLPEGNFFYISASLRPDASVQAVQDVLAKYISDLSAPTADLSWAPMFGQQMAQSLSSLPNLDALKAQLPPNVSIQQVEGNLGLQWGMNEFRYAGTKSALIKSLSQLNTQKVTDAAIRFLAPSKQSIVILQPPKN